MQHRTPEALGLQEIVRAEIYRATSGGFAQPEEVCVNDLITTAGRAWLAKRIGADVGSPMTHMAVGTTTTAPALGDTGLPGEIKRKALSTNSVLTANVYTAVMTIGGSADSVTSIAITEAGVFNHANSGQGVCFQRVTFSAVTLGNSDLLKITLETNVGSS